MDGYSLLLLRNGSGKILMQLRTDDAPTFPDCWGFFGGAIELGEDPLAALIREAGEELGYTCCAPRFLCSVHPESLQYPLHGGRRHYYLEDLDTGQQLRQREGKSMAWFSWDEMRSIKLAPHNFEIIDILTEKILNG